VNNAGIAGLNTPTVDYPIEGVGARAAHQPHQPVPVLPGGRTAMVRAGYGRIVTSPRSPARKAIPTRWRILRPKPGSISLTKSLGRSWRNRACGELRDAGGGENRISTR